VSTVQERIAHNEVICSPTAPRTVYCDDRSFPFLQVTKSTATSVAMNIEKSHHLMKCTVLICLFTLVLCGHSLAQATPASAHAANCSPALLDIDGNRIWMNEEGKGNITVVFEAGFGNDSSVWSQITPKIQAAGVQTFVYDRAGMGKSTINTSTPYSIDNDVYILRSALANCPYSQKSQTL
jgi:hypothetical protein